MNDPDQRSYVEVTTLGDLLVRQAVRSGGAEALAFPDGRWTYEELFRRARSTARGLRALGVGRGDHVGILMANSVEFIAVLFGAAMLGAVVVPINSRFRTRELGYVIDHADVKVVCTSDVVAEHADHPARIAEALPGIEDAADPAELRLDAASDLRAVVLLGGSSRPGFVVQETFHQLAGTVDIEEVEALRARVRLRDVAMILYTSGTTANPKGCVHTHEGLVRNGLVTGRTRFLLTAEDRFWDPLPMFHVGALLPLIATVDAGGTFLSMTHVDGAAALDQIEREQATWLFPAFPAITTALIDHPSFADRNLDAVRMTMTVGPPALLRRLQDAIPHAVQISTYGSTETGGVITYHRADDPAHKRATTCGPPFRGIEIAIRDLSSDQRLPPGEIGEILVRGYSITEGYYKDPEQTARAIDDDGWLHTGDLGALDADGHVTYEGRLKDMLKVGGENVSALEIETFLSEHPDIRAAQVVAAPDDRLDEVVAAFLELRPGAELSEADVVAYCEGTIASYKVPRHVRFVDEWPMSATKTQKHRLREQIAEEVRPTSGNSTTS